MFADYLTLWMQQLPHSVEQPKGMIMITDDITRCSMLPICVVQLQSIYLTESV